MSIFFFPSFQKGKNGQNWFFLRKWGDATAILSRAYNNSNVGG